MKKLLALSLIISAPAFAASICIVCPPGYDCSGGKPVAHTGNARLATIGDIPAAPTLASLGAVPTSRTIAGLPLSGDITVEQLREQLLDCQILSVNKVLESKCEGAQSKTCSCRFTIPTTSCNTAWKDVWDCQNADDCKNACAHREDSGPGSSKWWEKVIWSK